jgi:hypothetical protein
MTDQKYGSWTVAKDLIAGTVGGWAQVMAAQPFDTVKVCDLTSELLQIPPDALALQVRLQCQPEGAPIYSSASDCVKKTAAEGMGAFYKG